MLDGRFTTGIGINPSGETFAPAFNLDVTESGGLQ
jgi:hypothetical protein